MKTTFQLLLCALCLLPITGYAFVSTDQTGISVSDQTALYSITYRFGTTDRPFAVPYLAALDPADNELGFVILNDDGEVVPPPGPVSAAIVSSAAIRDGLYVLEPGQAASFTLYVALTLNADNREQDYAIQVTQLPTYLGTERQRVPMNASQLQYYVTPEVNLYH